MAENTKTDSLVNLLKTAKEDTNKVNILIILGSSDDKMINSDCKLTYLKEAKILAENLNYKKGINKTLNYLGLQYYNIGNLQEALNNHRLALKLSGELKDLSSLAYSYSNIGNVLWQQGNLKEALNYFEISLSILNKLTDLKGIANCKINIGTIYSMQGNSPEALKYYLESLKIYQKINDKKGISRATNNIGLVYLIRNENDEALKYFQESLKMCQAIGNTMGVISCYINIGQISLINGNYSEALRFIDFALKSSETISYKNGIVDCYGINGEIYRAQKKYDAALKNYFQSLQISREIGNKERIALTYIAIGQINLTLKKLNIAKTYLNNALSLSRELGAKSDIKDCYKSLAELDSTSGNFREAYQHYKMHKLYQDSLTNDETTKKIVESQMNFEFERKEAVSKAEQEKKAQQIILLKKENQLKAIIAKKENQKKNYAIGGMLVLLMVGSYTYFLYDKRKKLSNQLSRSLIDLEQTQDKLIQAEKEKEAENIRLRISRDIHDDIGHNLTKIALLSGISAHDKNIHNPETKETLNKIGDYSRQVNSSLSEIVWAISPKQDNLESLLVYMRSHIHKFFENTNIKYQINFPESIEFRSINPNLKRNIFLVLKESLNNILKYADAKNVTIHFVIAGSTFALTVKDDGRGFEFSSVLQTSSGIQNMKYRMEQRNGNFQIITSPGNGCEILANGVFET